MFIRAKDMVIKEMYCSNCGTVISSKEIEIDLNELYKNKELLTDLRSKLNLMNVNRETSELTDEVIDTIKSKSKEVKIIGSKLIVIGFAPKVVIDSSEKIVCPKCGSTLIELEHYIGWLDEK